jgi:hypothetical protein
LIDALRIQLILKGVIKQSEWDAIEESIAINYVEDNYFSELKEAEIIKERVEALNIVNEFVGQYYSKAWVRRTILKQTDEDIRKIQDEIEGEKKDEPDDDDLDI